MQADVDVEGACAVDRPVEIAAGIAVEAAQLRARHWIVRIEGRVVEAHARRGELGMTVLVGAATGQTAARRTLGLGGLETQDDRDQLHS